MTVPFTKRRDAAKPGSIPDRLQMFVREVRFYREVAPEIGVRVPDCLTSQECDGATLLELENLSSWREGADPADGARLLAVQHRHWSGRAVERFPWLPRPEVSDLVGDLFDLTWSAIRDRTDLTPVVRAFGDELVGRVTEVEQRAAHAGPITLVHGDASARNMRTSPAGEVALLDWEDYDAGPGIGDLAWFCVSSVAPEDWDEALKAYGDTTGLDAVLPAVVVQGLLSLTHEPVDGAAAQEWVLRLGEAAHRL